MRTPLKLAAFAGGLALAFGAAFTVGAAAEPLGSEPPTAEPHASEAMPGNGGHEAAPHAETTAAPLPGLAVSEAGYTLVPASGSLPSGPAVPFEFTVTGPDGRPVTAYAESHEKELHLVVVRRDLDGFQHVHPARAADGTWRVQLDLTSAGVHRVFADFQPAALDRELTLGTDVFVAGAFSPTPLPAASATDTVDGYDVTLDGSAVAGEETDLTFTVSRGGTAVPDLQPYLGAFGHLVSLRSGDLAYLHTHPVEDAQDGERGGPAVRFGTEFPTAGTYRLFLDFRVGGTVRTAMFTVTVGEGNS